MRQDQVTSSRYEMDILLMRIVEEMTGKATAVSIKYDMAVVKNDVSSSQGTLSQLSSIRMPCGRGGPHPISDCRPVLSV